jgi:F-type H+-transporting ATP synthase subunit e
VTKRAEIEHEYARKERLIEQAKAEYKKKTQPQETKTQTSGRTFNSLR